MDLTIKDKFQKLWGKYFDGAELPITFYYTNAKNRAELAKQSKGWRCLLGDLAKVRAGKALCFDYESLGCGGGQRYLGFTHELRENFEYFLSFGIPGKLEGERYKKTPELVKEVLKNMPDFTAPATFIVFKRWDMLEEKDEPEVVIFFASPDVLSGSSLWPIMMRRSLTVCFHRLPQAVVRSCSILISRKILPVHAQ
jgi:hypothetical protein